MEYIQSLCSLGFESSQCEVTLDESQPFCVGGAHHMMYTSYRVSGKNGVKTLKKPHIHTAWGGCGIGSLQHLD